jgi:nucleoside-diphosphate-sugar epimerase
MGWRRNMKVLVTGGTGFLGKKLAYRLKDLGYHVIVIARNQKIGHELERNQIQFIKCDLANRERVIESCHGIDYVFHCAAFSSPWGKYEEFYESNVVGTENVIAGCLKHRVKRFIHVSTPSIYFDFDERLNVKEDDPLPQQFVNHYAYTKYLAERLVDEAGEQGLGVITIRPRALFGPEDTTIIPRLIKVNKEKFIPLVNNGEVLLDLTYVENVVDALLLCMTSNERTLGQKYNITNGEVVSLKDVLEVLFKKIHQPLRTKRVNVHLLYGLASILEWLSIHFQNEKEPLLTKYTVSVISKSQTLNIDKAKSELGYMPRVSIEEGINEFAKWWVTQNYESRS